VVIQAVSSAFEFATAGRIVFGAGRATELGALTTGFGSRALVCTGSLPERHQPLTDLLSRPTEVVTVAGEPTIEVARAAAEAARAHAADLVVAIGGGSVLDVGKAVAMLLGNGGDPLDYLEIVGRGKPITQPSLPFVAVPTTAGTGAEVTENAVLTSAADGRKASLRSRLMLPHVALVDPLLTVSCPPAVTASSGLDALTQCLEPFVSARATPVTDGLSSEGLRRAASGLRAVYRDGSDVDARTDMSICSLLGGLALANAKLGAVHGFAAVIGGMTAAAHGAVCAALLAAVVETNVRALRGREPANPALDRYDEAARILTGRPEATVEDGIDWIRETVDQLQVPGLAALGVRPDDASEIVTKAHTASSMKFNPITLTDDELHTILDMSMRHAPEKRDDLT
jgi:alcohol dehydrogenase class IV